MIASEAIQKTKDLFESMGLSLTLRDVGITDKTNFVAMAEKAMDNGLDECKVKYSTETIVEMFNKVF